MRSSAERPRRSDAAPWWFIVELALAAFAALSVAAAAAQPEARAVRRAEDTLVSFAHRLVPPHSEIATRPVELDLPPLGKIVVILIRPEGTASNLSGWVLIPNDDKAASYRKSRLPPMELAESLFEIEVQSIFSAKTNAAASPVLCVLYTYYRTGSGEEGGYATEVYAWRSEGFARLPEVAKHVTGLKNARQVRTRLKSQDSN